jgi:putative thioredoxin
MTSSPQRLSTHGAVDLSAFKRPAQPAATAGAGQASSNTASPYVVDVTEATFEADVIVRSAVVPVVVDFWAEWCEPCKQLSPLLERLADEAAGRWMLAKIDVDANQRLAGAAGVQSIPMVLGVIAGQAVPLFTGALPEAEVRRYLDELIKVAVANGVTGRIAGPPAGEPGDEARDEARDEAQPPAPAADPYADAMDLLVAGDLDRAADAYDALLAQRPGDPDAARGRALVDLARRVGHLDQATVLAAAAVSPDDVEAQCLAADIEVASGTPDSAFKRLVELVRRSNGDDRDAARVHLVGLFAVLGPADPRVAAARTALANALF